MGRKPQSPWSGKSGEGGGPPRRALFQAEGMARLKADEQDSTRRVRREPIEQGGSSDRKRKCPIKLGLTLPGPVGPWEDLGFYPKHSGDPGGSDKFRFTFLKVCGGCCVKSRGGAGDGTSWMAGDPLSYLLLLLCRWQLVVAWGWKMAEPGPKLCS